MEGRVTLFVRDKKTGKVLDVIEKKNHITDEGLKYVFDRLFPGIEKRTELSHIAVGIGAYNPASGEYDTFDINDADNPYPRYLPEVINAELQEAIPDTTSHWNGLQTEVARSPATYRGSPENSTAAIIAAEFSAGAAYYNNFEEFAAGKAQAITEAGLFASNFEIDKWEGIPTYFQPVNQNIFVSYPYSDVTLAQSFSVLQNGTPLNISSIDVYNKITGQLYEEHIDYNLYRSTGHLERIPTGRIARTDILTLIVNGTNMKETRHFFNARRPSHANSSDLDNDHVEYGVDNTRPDPITGQSKTGFIPMTREQALQPQVFFAEEGDVRNIISVVGKAGFNTITTEQAFTGDFRSFKRPSLFHATPIWPFGNDTDKEAFDVENRKEFSQNATIKLQQAKEPGGVVKTSRYKGEEISVRRNSAFNKDGETGIKAGISNAIDFVVQKIKNTLFRADKTQWVIPGTEGTIPDSDGARIVEDGAYFITKEAGSEDLEESRLSLDKIRAQRQGSDHPTLHVAPRSKLPTHAFRYSIGATNTYDKIRFRWRGLSTRGGKPIRTRFFVKYYAKKKVASSVSPDLLDSDIATANSKTFWEKASEKLSAIKEKLVEGWATLNGAQGERTSYEIKPRKYSHILVSSEQVKYSLPEVPMSPNELPSVENVDTIVRTAGWNPEAGNIDISEPNYRISNENISVNGVVLAQAYARPTDSELTATNSFSTEFPLVSDNSRALPVIIVAAGANAVERFRLRYVTEDPGGAAEKVKIAIDKRESGLWVEKDSLTMVERNTGTTTRDEDMVFVMQQLNDKLPMDFAAVFIDNAYATFLASQITDFSASPIELSSTNTVPKYITVTGTGFDPILYSFTVPDSFSYSLARGVTVYGNTNGRKALQVNEDYVLQPFVPEDSDSPSANNKAYVVRLHDTTVDDITDIRLLIKPFANLGDAGVILNPLSVLEATNPPFTKTHPTGFAKSISTDSTYFMSATDDVGGTSILTGYTSDSDAGTSEFSVPVGNATKPENIAEGDFLIVSSASDGFESGGNHEIFRVSSNVIQGDNHVITIVGQDNDTPGITDSSILLSTVQPNNSLPLYIKEAAKVTYTLESEPVIELYMAHGKYEKDSAHLWSNSEENPRANFDSITEGGHAWEKLSRKVDGLDDEWDYDINFDTGEVLFNEQFLEAYATDQRVVGYRMVARAVPMWKLIGRTRVPDGPNDVLEVDIELTLPDETATEPRTTHFNQANRDYRLTDDQNVKRAKAINAYSVDVTAYQEIFSSWFGLGEAFGDSYSVSNNDAELEFINAKPAYAKLDYEQQGVNPFEEYVNPDDGIIEIIAVSYPSDHEEFGKIEGQSFELFTDMAIIEVEPGDQNYIFKRFYDYNYQIGDNYITWIKETTASNRGKSIRSSHQWDKSVRPTLPTGDYGINYIRNNTPDNPNTARIEEDLMFSRVKLDNPIEINRDMLLTVVWQVDVK